MSRPAPPIVSRLAGAGMAALAAAVPVATAYVLYYHAFGEWAVVCWKDLIGPRRSCYIEAPPSSLSAGGGAASVRIEPDDGTGYAVTVAAGSGAVLGKRVILRVDGNAPHERAPDRLDDVVWRGGVADLIVDELRRGRTLSLRFPAAAEGAGEMTIPLAGFADAFAAFHARLSALGAETAPPD